MSSSSNALIRKPDAELMPPPPPAKRIKRPPKVLDEDTYTDALSEIIARDFFPGLLEMKHQQEYLDALDSHDTEWISEARKKLDEVMTPVPSGRRRRKRGTGTSFASTNSTPRFGEAGTPFSVISTPGSTVSRGSSLGGSILEGLRRKQEVDTNMSLDAFQAKYTSEDNASFNDLLDKQNEKRRSAYAWMWNGNKIAGNRAIMARNILKEREEKERERNGGELVLKTSITEDLDARRAAPETWKSKPRNDFMFIPEGVDVDSLPPPSKPATEAEKQKEDLLPPKSISYPNTRLPPPQLVQPQIPPSPSLSAIQDAIAGHPRHSPSSILTTGSSTPRINGYAFVPDAPSATPTSLGAPPMTWGTLDGLSSAPPTPAHRPNSPTPSSTSTYKFHSHALFSSSSAAAPSPFKLAAPPRRELLLNKMVDKVARNKRASNILSSAAATLTGSSNPSSSRASTPSTVRSRLGNSTGFLSRAGTPAALTPAGHRLWSNVAGAGTPRGGGGGEERIFGASRGRGRGKSREH